jgi:hypothetical protein
MSLSCRWTALMLVLSVVLSAGCLPGEPGKEQPAQEKAATKEPAARPVQAPPLEPAPPVPEPVVPPTQPVREPAPKPPAPPATGENPQAPEPGKKETHAADIFMPTLEETQDEGFSIGVQLWPAEKGKGFDVSGSMGLSGTIELVEGAEENWVFKGSITFPTGGYTLGEPFLVPLGAERMVINLPITLPNPSAMVTQAQETRPFEYRFNAPEHVFFQVTFWGE